MIFTELDLFINMLRNKVTLVILAIIMLVHSLVLTKLIYFPFPELFVYPYLTNQGLKPYSQILDQHFPGLMFLPLNLDNLGMNTPEVARIWSIGIVVLVQLMLFFISKDIFKSRKKALLINLLYLIWQPFFEGWVLWVDNFLPLLLLPAFYFLRKEKLFVAGIFLGLSIVFKQVLIPLSFFVLIYIFWKTRDAKAVFRYIAGVAIPIASMILYLLSTGVFGDFWFWTVVFNLTTYAQLGRGEGPTLAHLFRVVFVFGLSFIVVRKIKFDEGKLLLIFLIGTLIGLTTRFDFVHFQPALPFAILGTILGLEGIRGVRRFGVVAVYSLVAIWWLVIFYRGHLGDRVIAFDDNTKLLAEKIRQYTEEKDKIFVYGGQPHLYQMSKTLPAGDIFVFQFPWFLKVAEGRVLEGVKRDKPQIIVYDPAVKIENQSITEFAPNIHEYIIKNYQKIDSAGTAQVLKKI